MSKRSYASGAVLCFMVLLIGVEAAAQVTVTHLSPASGVVGATVRIHGTDFLAGTPTVEFGGTAATSVAVLNDHLLLADVPAGAAAGYSTVQVKVGLSASTVWPFSVLVPTAGTQNFIDQTPLRLPLLLSPSRNVIGDDIDGDGDPDLANVSQGRDAILVDDGAGFFADEVDTRLLGADRNAGDGDFCDVDGDGDFDLVVVNRGFQNNQLFLNDGAGTFTEAVGNLPALSDFSRDAACGDFDRDGDVDLVVASTGGASSLLINDGTGVFADETAARGLAGLSALALDVGDVENDGDLDVVFDGGAGLYLNDGTGHFAAAGLPAFLGLPVELLFGDVDDDGDLDLVVPNSGGVQNQLFINDGTGAFADETAARLPADPAADNDFAAALGDIDGDGDLDLVTGVVNGPDHAYRNDGTGVFTPAEPGTTSDISLATTGLELADVDGDGHLDLAVGSLQGEAVSLFIGSAAEVNRAPDLAASVCGAVLARPRRQILFNLSATDPDGDPLAFGARNLPAGMTLNSHSGVAHWMPSVADAGEHFVGFHVADSKMGTDRHLVDLAVETGAHDFNGVGLLVGAHGNLGQRDDNGNGGFAFFPQGACNQHIFSGGPWIGGTVGGTPVVAQFRFASEFVPSEIGATGTFFRAFNSSIPADLQTWPPEFSTAKGKPVIVAGAQNVVTQYNDAAGPQIGDVPMPLGVEVRQRSLAYNDAHKRDAIIFLWEITNVSGQPIDDAYFGFWSDTDIGLFSDDRTSTVSDMAIAWDDDFSEAGFSEPPAILGFDFLETPGNAGVANYATFGSINQEPGTDAAQYDYLTGASTFETDSATEVRLLLSTGPFDLADGASAVVAGALLFGRAPEGTTALATHPVTFRPDPADPVLADLLAAQAAARDFYDKKLKGTGLPKHDDVADAAAPEAFALRPNYPNPFAAETTIPYALPEAARVTIRVYDVLGRDVATLVNGERLAGLHQARWDGLLRDGRSAGSGLYVVRMTAGAVVRTLKVLRVR